MPQLARALRMGMALTAMLALAACGRSEEQEIAVSAAPVRHVVASLAQHGAWKSGNCLCVGHFREDVVEDFPAGVLDGEFARHPWLRKWSECAPYYGRAKNLKGCAVGMTDFICSVAERSDLPKGTARVLCHVNGEDEALQQEYLQDEYDVTFDNGTYHVRPVSLKGTGILHE
jgi:hypothetical protein